MNTAWVCAPDLLRHLGCRIRSARIFCLVGCGERANPLIRTATPSGSEMQNRRSRTASLLPTRSDDHP